MQAHSYTLIKEGRRNGSTARAWPGETAETVRELQRALGEAGEEHHIELGNEVSHGP